MEHPLLNSKLKKAFQNFQRKGESNEDENVFEKISRILLLNRKYEATDDIICACYLYRFCEYGNKKDYDNFKKIFTKLSDEDRSKAINYYLNYIENSKKQNSSNNKKMQKTMKR